MLRNKIQLNTQLSVTVPTLNIDSLKYYLKCEGDEHVEILESIISIIASCVSLFPEIILYVRNRIIFRHGT